MSLKRYLRFYSQKALRLTLFGILYRIFRLREFQMHTFYEPPLRQPEALVLDLGACVGRFSLALLKRYPCKVLAVEPSLVLLNKIPEHLRLEKLNFAVFNTNHYSEYYEGEDCESGNLFSAAAPSKDFPKKVKTVTLERLLCEKKIFRVSLLKIDIEGSEIALFNSLKDETLQSFEQISVEFHDFCSFAKVSPLQIQEVIQRLRNLGFLYFNFSTFYPRHLDCFFIRKDKAPRRLKLLNSLLNG